MGTLRGAFFMRREFLHKLFFDLSLENYIFEHPFFTESSEGCLVGKCAIIFAYG